MLIPMVHVITNSDSGHFSTVVTRAKAIKKSIGQSYTGSVDQTPVCTVSNEEALFCETQAYDKAAHFLPLKVYPNLELMCCSVQ